MSLQTLAESLMPKYPVPLPPEPENCPPPAGERPRLGKIYPHGTCSVCGMRLTGEFAYRRSLLQTDKCDSCGGDDLDEEVAE